MIFEFADPKPARHTMVQRSLIGMHMSIIRVVYLITRSLQRSSEFVAAMLRNTLQVAVVDLEEESIP